MSSLRDSDGNLQTDRAGSATTNVQCCRVACAGGIRRDDKRPVGFTLVELLVVIAIIGILVALLLPAVQAAREAARRIQCANHFKQVALAMHSYHTAHNCFPPGALFWSSDFTSQECYPFGDSAAYDGVGWATFILPFIEQQAIYDQFNMKHRTTLELQSFRAAGNRVPTYICPSEPSRGELVIYTSTNQNGPHKDDDCGQTNIAGVTDSVDWTCDRIWAKQFTKADGSFGNNGVCTIAQIRDGTTHTILVGEVTGGGPGSRTGFSWVSFPLIDTRDGINGPFTIPGSDFYAATVWGFRESGASSYHPGGCFFAMADGSVHFFSESIAANVLKSLTTKAGGEVASVP